MQYVTILDQADEPSAIILLSPFVLVGIIPVYDLHAGVIHLAGRRIDLAPLPRAFIAAEDALARAEARAGLNQHPHLGVASARSGLSLASGVCDLDFLRIALCAVLSLNARACRHANELLEVQAAFLDIARVVGIIKALCEALRSTHQMLFFVHDGGSIIRFHDNGMGVAHVRLDHRVHGHAELQTRGRDDQGCTEKELAVHLCVGPERLLAAARAWFFLDKLAVLRGRRRGARCGEPDLVVWSAQIRAADELPMID